MPEIDGCKDNLAFLLTTVKTVNTIAELFMKEEVIDLEYSIEEKIRNAVETKPDIIGNTDISTNNYRVKFCNVYMAGDSTKTPVGFFKSISHIIKKDYDSDDLEKKERNFTTTHKTIVLDNVPGIAKDSAIFGSYCYYSTNFIPAQLPIKYTAHSSDKTFDNKTVRVSLNKINDRIGTITIVYKPNLIDL
jgi:hypothetical protein